MIYKIHTTILLGILLLSVNQAVCANEKNAVGLHSGSMKGLVNLFYSRKFWQKHNLSVGLGYIPKLKNHSEIALVSLGYLYSGKTKYVLSKLSPNLSIQPFNFGISMIVSESSHLFNRLPDDYPRDYYYPTGRRYFLNYQITLSHKNQTEFYSEFSIIDVGVVNYVRNFKFYRENYDFLGLDGVVTWGLGVRRRF